MPPRGLVLLLLLATAGAFAAEGVTPETGPAVPGYGPVFPVPEGVFNLSNDRLYKVTKDVSRTSDAPDAINSGIESAARFLNMQARHGTRPDQLEMAIVVHGGAVKDLLSDAAYRSRFGIANPSTGLLGGLGKAGVKIYLCGQTATNRGVSADELHPGVTMALSAMAAHVQLQSEGYTLIPF